jgi:hypothetical protein
MRPPRAGEQNEITSIESPEVVCTIGNKPIPPKYKTPQMTVAMVCTKSVDEGRVLAFNTNWNNSVPIKLAGFSEGVIVELQQKIAGLSQSLTIAREALKATDASVAAEKAAIRYTFTEKGAACPASWRDIGSTGILIEWGKTEAYAIGPGLQLYQGWSWGHPTLCKRP